MTSHKGMTAIDIQRTQRIGGIRSPFFRLHGAHSGWRLPRRLVPPLDSGQR